MEQRRLVIVRSDELSAERLAAIRAMLERAFADEGFDDNDWAHTLGGVHFLLEAADGVVSHASVVRRSLVIQGRAFDAGYVESVATAPEHEGSGYGSTVMRAAADHIVATYELGALCTGRNGFYERLAWETWRGPTGVRTAQGVEATPEEDGAVMVLRAPASADIDLTGEITCDWRIGDVW